MSPDTSNIVRILNANSFLEEVRDVRFFTLEELNRGKYVRKGFDFRIAD